MWYSVEAFVTFSYAHFRTGKLEEMEWSSPKVEWSTHAYIQYVFPFNIIDFTPCTHTI